MFTPYFLLAIIALILTLVHAVTGKVPLWIPVLLVTIILLLPR